MLIEVTFCLFSSTSFFTNELSFHNPLFSHRKNNKYAVKVRRYTPWSLVRCHGSHECWFTHRQFHSQYHSRRHSLRITLKSTTLVCMCSSNAWTTKPWQRCEWRLGFNSVLKQRRITMSLELNQSPSTVLENQTTSPALSYAEQGWDVSHCLAYFLDDVWYDLKLLCTMSVGESYISQPFDQDHNIMWEMCQS